MRKGEKNYVAIYIFMKSVKFANELLPIAYNAMKANNQLLLLRSESASSNIRPQIINPPQTTTLATPLKP